MKGWMNVEKPKTYPEMNERIVGILRIGDSQPDHYAAQRIEELEAELEETKRYKTALRKIVCLNIPMPDEVFNIANDALEGR